MAKPDAKEKFIANFLGQDVVETYPSQKQVRSEAEKALVELDLPSRRDEYWKYTRVNSIIKQEYSQTPNFQVEAASPYIIDELDAHLLVFVNGHFSEKLSNLQKEEGLLLMPIAKARTQHPEIVEQHYGKIADHQSQVFTALNTVYNTNGVLLHLPANKKLEKPVLVLNLSVGEAPACNPRNLIVLEKGSEATLIHAYRSEAEGAFTNTVTEVSLAENAHLDHYIIQNENDSSAQVNTIHARQKKDSNYSAYTFTLNSNWVRNNLNIDADAENIETNMFGLYALKGKEHVDNHTQMDHLQPNCNSNELYKGIIAGKATGVFNGKVFVRQHAQKTNAFQSNQNILLNDSASVYSKPELEIYADDVKCSHGSTTGQMDEEALFYLRARGIKKSAAEAIMIKAFLADVTSNIKHDAIKEHVESLIESYHQNS